MTVAGRDGHLADHDSIRSEHDVRLALDLHQCGQRQRRGEVTAFVLYEQRQCAHDPVVGIGCDGRMRNGRRRVRQRSRRIGAGNGAQQEPVRIRLQAGGCGEDDRYAALHRRRQRGVTIVGGREHEVVDDDLRSGIDEPVHEIRLHLSRPWPRLAELVERTGVDAHDRDALVSDAGREQAVGRPLSEALKRARVHTECGDRRRDHRDHGGGQ